ncbi:MAG: ribosome-binding factor [Bacteriovoracaceae bacterium]|nr:ribosome-binding factor [Bacteriovoracaceae bacterium]
MKPQRMKYSDDRKERRHHRVVELLRMELTSIIQREVKDPRMGPFTITEIVLSPDIRSATIHVCRFMTGEGQNEPTKEQQEDLITALNSASHFIYERLKKRLAMKQIPSIKFVYDYRMLELSNIWNLVKKATDTNPEEDPGEDDSRKGASHGSF